jgi:hypothetical protein
VFYPTIWYDQNFTTRRINTECSFTIDSLKVQFLWFKKTKNKCIQLFANACIFVDLKGALILMSQILLKL